MISLVAPCVGAWIEMANRDLKMHDLKEVAPCVGAWIEIPCITRQGRETFVAPCVGAWIEILYTLAVYKLRAVAPCVGAWIEIHLNDKEICLTLSLPAWERGLK